jgi:four helix bundle protein
MAYAFENMKAWQEARKLVGATYRLLDDFPKFENYALCDQIRRAVVSVPSNLAEGSGRISVKEQLRFYEIAYGALMEIYNQLIIVTDLNYLDKNKFEDIRPQIDIVAKMLNGLRNSMIKKINENGK